MGYYTVLTPCVVGQLHYATIPAHPIEADDTVAADLVSSGAIAPYRPGGTADPSSSPAIADEPVVGEPDGPTPARPRRRRSHDED